MTHLQPTDPSSTHFRKGMQPETVIRQLRHSLSRVCDWRGVQEETDAHLWVEGPLPGKLAGCLHCEEFRSRTGGRTEVLPRPPERPWRAPQRLIVLCGQRDPQP